MVVRQKIAGEKDIPTPLQYAKQKVRVNTIFPEKIIAGSKVFIKGNFTGNPHLVG